MEFDKSKVYTALNADELEVGSKVICATCLANLKEYVADYFNEGVDNTCIITSILNETYGSRFQTDTYNSPLAYLVSVPEEGVAYCDVLDKQVEYKGTDLELANKYFNEECKHSYTDNEEQLKEDVISAFLKGLKIGREEVIGDNEKIKDETIKET